MRERERVAKLSNDAVKEMSELWKQWSEKERASYEERAREMRIKSLVGEAPPPRVSGLADPLAAPAAEAVSDVASTDDTVIAAPASPSEEKSAPAPANAAPSERRFPWFLLCAAVLAVVLVGGVIVAIRRGRR
jgi:hypothetical protein